MIEKNELSMKIVREELEQACDQKVQRYRDLSGDLEQVNKDLINKCESLNKSNRALEQ